MRSSSAEQRSAVRAFVRRNHPDVGGDPEHFAAGLAELRARPGGGRSGSAGPGSAGSGSAGSGPTGFDAPVIGVQRPRGLRGAARRWRERRVRRKRRRVR